MQCSTKTCAQLRCFENGNDDFGVEAFWIGDAARVGYFVPLNGPLNGHPPSIHYHGLIFHKNAQKKNKCIFHSFGNFRHFAAKIIHDSIQLWHS